MSADDFRSWLQHARHDLKSIRNNIHGPDPSPESAAYHCQQAAEKLVKAVLVYRGITPPKIHSIRPLLELLGPADAFRDRLASLVRFTAFSYAYRYPSFSSHEPSFEPPETAELEEWLAELLALEMELLDKLRP